MNAPTLDSIHKALLRDYHSELGRHGYEQQPVDPALDTILRVFASRMEKLYGDHEGTRLALLDELIRGLSVEPRRAVPAQAVIRFSVGVRGESVRLTEGDIFFCDGPDGEKFPFAADREFLASKARIAMAFAYQQRKLRPCCDQQWGQTGELIPEREAVSADWGDGNSLLIALDDLPAGSLDGLAIFCDIPRHQEEVQRMMARSVWRVADADGRFGPAGYYRAHPSRSGVMVLRLAEGPNGAPAEEQPEWHDRDLSRGFYRGNTFLFPFRNAGVDGSPACVRPRGLEAAIAKIFPATAAEALNRQRTWLRISCVPEAGSAAFQSLSTAFSQMVLHTMTFSNVECRDQTVDPGRKGASVAIQHPGAGRYLVGLRAIHEGRRETPIVPLLDAAAPVEYLRYSIRSGRIEVVLPAGSAFESDRVVNIRVLTTHGDRASELPSKGFPTEWTPKEGQVVKITVVKPPQGGSNEEERSTAEARFASAILSRGRIVTQADLLAAARAFDSRIVGATATPVFARRGSALRMIQRIAIKFNSAEFPPSTGLEERRNVCEELEISLRGRLPFDTDVEIKPDWDLTEPEETE